MNVVNGNMKNDAYYNEDQMLSQPLASRFIVMHSYTRDDLTREKPEDSVSGLNVTGSRVIKTNQLPSALLAV